MIFTQYFLYPKSLGGTRLEWLFPFDFQRIFWRFKLQYFSGFNLLVFKAIICEKK